MNNPGTNFAFVLVLGFFFLNHAYSQPLYRHFKRVKIEKKEVGTPEKIIYQYGNNQPVLLTPLLPLTPQKKLFPHQKKITFPIIHPDRILPLIKHVIPKKTFSFQKSKRLLYTKQVNNVNMERWMLAMILLYGLGLILLVLAVVFTVTLNSPLLVILFSIFAGLCLAAASIILPLGLAGAI